MNRYFIDESKKKSAVSVLFVLLVALFSFFIGSALAMSGGAEDTPVANAYTTSGTAITNEAGFKAIRNKSTNAYLANDIILTNTTGFDSSKASATPFSGKLYGNGKTITINMGYELGAISDATTHYIGLLFAYLQGTVQDCNIVLNGNVSLYESVGGDTNYLTILGIVCGRLQGGTISNVNVIVNGAFNFIGRDTGGTFNAGGGTGTLVGGFAGCTSGGTITNCNLINNNCIFGAAEDDDGNDDQGSTTRVCVGGFIGEVEAGVTLNMTNIGINGAQGSIIGAQINYNKSGNHKSNRSGGIIGSVRDGATVNITGLDYKYKGYIVISEKNSAYGNYIIGRIWNNATVRVKNTVFSRFYYPRLIKSTSALSRVSLITPMNFNNDTPYDNRWPYTNGLSAKMTLMHTMTTGTIVERLVAGITTGWTFTDYGLDDGSVDFIFYNNASESASYTVLSWEGESNSYHNISTLNSYFSGLEGSTTYTWNSIDFNVRLQMGLGMASPLNIFNSQLNFYGNAFNKTLYITGDAVSNDIFLFQLGLENRSPIIEFNVNSQSTAFPIIDQSTISGGSVKITGGTHIGSWAAPGIGTVQMQGVSPLTVTGGTILNTGAGEAIFSNNPAILIAGGIIASSVNLTANTATVTNTGSGGIAISGGEVSNEGVGRAVVSYLGLIAISGNAKISSSPPEEYGTVANYSTYATTVSGGTITNGSSGSAVYVAGSGPASFTGGTVTSSGGKAVFAVGSGALSISGGTYNGAYSVYYVSSVSSFTLSSAPALNGTTADIYAGKAITAPNITGGAYTLTWAGSTANGTTVVSGSSNTSKFTLKNSGYALYASGSNIKIGKVSNVSYYGVTSTSGLVTSYIESQAKTLTVPGASNIAAGLTYAGMYTSSGFTTSLSSISTSATGTVSVFVKKTLNYSINASATSMTYGDGSITLSASTSADTSKLSYAWTKNSAAYSSAATAALSLVEHSGTYGLNLVYTETSGSYTLVSNGTTSNKTITISKRQLTISGVDAVDRVFNNTTTVSLTGGTLVNYKDGNGASNNSLLGFNLGSAAISSAAAGTYSVSGISITLNGSKAANYQLTQPSGINVVISAKSLATDLTIGTVSNVTYSGSAHTPKPQLSDSIQTLVENRDFTFSYLNNTNAGTATLNITGTSNYTGSRSVTFTINSKNLSSGIAVEVISDFYYSGAANTPVPELTYTQYSLSLLRGTSSSGDYWFTYSDNINVGTATITANGRGNYSGTLTASFTILKADVSISVNGLSALTYGQTLANSTITGTAVNAQHNSVSVSGNWSFVLPLNTQPDIGTSSFSVSFTPEMSANYNTPANISANLTVLKCTPVLSGITASAVEYRREVSTSVLSGTAKNGHNNTVVTGVFAFANPSAIAYDGTAYEIIFRPADTARYLNATSSVTVSVVPRLLTVTAFDAVDRTYDATITISIFSYTLIGIYGSESVSIEATGTISAADASDTAYTVQITSFALAGEHKDNYYINAYDETVDVMISPLTIAVTADYYSKTYGATDPTFRKVIDSTTADGTLAILFLRDTANKDKQNVGIYDFNSVQLETPDSNYHIVFAPDGGKDKFVINPYALIVTTSNFSKTYGDADPAFAEDFAGVYDETVNVTYTRATGNNVGAYSFVAVSLTEPNQNYLVSFAANGGKDKFVISPYVLIVTASDFSKVYDEADPAFVEDFTGVYAETVNVTYTRETGNNVGAYSFIGVVQTEVNPNYEVSFAEDGGKDKFVISPYALIVTASSFNKTYGEADPEFTEDFTGAYEETVNVTYTREAGNNVGAYSFISVVLTEANPNYEVSFAADGGKDKFVISPYELIVTASSFGKIYGEADPAFTEDFTGTYDETVNVTYTREVGENAGAYSFTSIIQTETNPNYTVSFAENGGKDKFVISPYVLKVTARNYSKTYGEADPAFVEDFTGVYAETVNVTYTRETGNNVGAYSLTSVAQTEVNPNYEVSFSENGGKDKFIINSYALIVTARSFSKTYGDADPSFTEEHQGAYAENINVTYSREAGNNAGAYNFISVVQTQANPNYTVSFATNGGKDKFVISPYALIVTASDFSKVYGEADPVFVEDFAGAYDETVNVAYTRESGNNAGVYSFVAVALTQPNENYTVSFAANGGKDKFVISPYELYVTASSYSKIYGEADPAFTEDFTGIYDENINVIYTRQAGNNVGAYSFISVVLTEANPNYEVSFAADGGKDKFVISPYSLIVTANNFGKTYGEADPIFIEDFAGAYEETVNVIYTREAGNNVGTYSFVAVTSLDTNYAVCFSANGGKDKFAINPYELIVAAKNYSKTYGEADPIFTEDFAGAYEETVNVIYTREAGNNVGTYSFVAVTSLDINYAVCFSANGGKDKFAINPYELIVAAKNYSKVYGAADPAFTEDFAGVYDETVNVTYAREAGNNVGLYSFVTVSITQPNENYTVSFSKDGGKDKFVISPYSLFVTARSFTKIYGAADPAFAEDFTGAYAETVNVTYTREAGENVGAYSFVAVTSLDTNYAVCFSADGGKDKFIISPYVLIVTTSDFSKVYGEADPVFVEDLAGAYDETVNVTYTRESGNNAGVYSFVAVSITEPDENYTVSFAEDGGKDKFVISPYALIVAAKSYSKTYGAADPSFTEDFAGAYDETVNVAYTRESGNNTGVYSFVAVALTQPNENYIVSLSANGGKNKFVISPYELIVAPKNYSKTYGAADPEFTEDFTGIYDETVNVTYTREMGNNVGAYSFTNLVQTEANPNYVVSFSAEGGKDKFIISPYSLIVTARSFTKIYGEADPAFTEDVTGAYAETVNVTYAREAGNNVGAYSFTSVIQTEANPNYEVSLSANGGKDKFVISPYALIVVAKNYSKIYGEADSDFTEDFTGAYVENINVTYSREAGEDAGSYSFIVISLTQPNENYTVSFAENGGKDKFVISPYALIVAAKSYSKTYGAADPEITEDFIGIYDENIKVIYSREAGNNAGFYSFIAVSLTQPNENYTVSFAENGGKDKFIISPYELIVTASSFGKTYGAADPEFTEDFTGVYGETVKVTYTRESGNNAGVYNFVEVSLTEPNENYTVSFAEDGGKDKFIISPYELIVTARSFSKTYGEADPAFVENFTGAYDETVNVTYTREAGNNVGTYSFVAVTWLDINYAVCFSANGGKDKFVISPYVLIVTASNFNKTYGEADPAFVEDFAGVYDETVNITYTRESGNNVGVYSFTSVVQTQANPNYTVSFALNGGKDKLVISPYQLIVTASSFGKIYGEADPAFIEEFTGAFDETVNVTYTREAGNNVGTYSFVAVTSLDTNYAVCFSANGGKEKFAINPYALTVNACSFNKTYGEADPAFVEDFTGAYDETVNVTYTRATGNNVGLYCFVAVSLTEPDENYIVSFAADGGKDKFIINPYSLIVTVRSFNKIYGEADPEFTEDFTGAYEETVNVTYTREAGNNVGAYSFISVVQTEANPNYEVSFATDGGEDKFAINPYALIVTASIFSKTYGEADPAFTEEFTGTYDETVNVTYTRESGNNAGVYSFVAVTSLDTNYAVGFSANGGKEKFVISPYALIVGAKNYCKIYGESDPAFTEDFEGAYDETVNVTYTRESGNNAGVYSFISVSLTEPNENYTVSFEANGGKDKFVINPYELIVAAKNYSKTYGEADPAFVEDFAGAYDETIHVTYTREAGNNVGAYSFISIVQTEANSNYEVSFAADGGKDKFVINPYELILATKNYSKIYGEADPILTEDFAGAYEETVNVTYTREEGNNVGVYSFVEVSLTEPNENYAVSFDSNGGKDKFVISPYALTLTARSFSKTYGEADPDFIEDFIGAYDETVNVTYTRESGNNAEVYSFISISLTGPNENYTVSFEANGGKDKFVINPYELIVAAKNYSKIYGEADPDFIEDFAGAYEETINVTYSREAGNNAGAYNFISVVQTQPNPNYTVSFALNGGKDKFVISPYKLIVTASSFDKIYGDTDPEFTEDFAGAYDETISVTYTRESGNNAGIYSFVAVSLTEPDENYTVSFAANGAKDKFEIEPYLLYVISSDYVKVYGEQDPRFTDTFDGINNETVCVNFDRDRTDSACENVGVYDLLYAVSLDNNYLAFLTADGGKAKLEIIPLRIKIEIDNKTSGFNAPLSSLTWRLTEDSAATIDGDDLNVVLTKSEGTDIGNYDIIGRISNANYQAEFINGIYTITKGTIDMSAVRFDDKTVEYNAENQSVVILNGTLPQQIKNVIYTNNIGKDPGVYYASAEFVYDNINYYQVDSITAVLTILPRKLTVNFYEPDNIYYDGTQKTVRVDFNNIIESEAQNIVPIITYNKTVIQPDYYEAKVSIDNNYYVLTGQTTFDFIIYKQEIKNEKESEQDVIIEYEKGFMPDSKVIVANLSRREEISSGPFKGKESKQTYEINIEGSKLAKDDCLTLKLLIDDDYRFLSNLSMGKIDAYGNIEEIECTREGDYLIFNASETQGTYIIIGEGKGKISREVAALAGSIAAIIMAVAGVVVAWRMRKKSLKVLAEKLNAVLE